MKAVTFLVLLVNLIKCALLSGWDTARVILQKPGRSRPGLIDMPYRELSPAQASLVGALITLAPGTTTVHIDPQRQLFRLHLLDLTQSDATLRAIERDFIEPLQRLNGAS
jgi:multisubunit Na+/H+ antiporter MnhE subunit